jgi:transcriptional regulator with XRE-family HTH domain
VVNSVGADAPTSRWFGTTMVDDTAATGHAGGNTRSAVGGRIRALRLQQGMNQRELAERAHYDKSYVSMIERGLRLVDSRSTLERFAQALGVPPSGLTGQPYPATDHDQVIGHAAASVLRAVLRDIELGVPSAPDLRSVRELQLEVATIRERSAASDYAAYAPIVPAVITELHTLAQTSGQARRLLGHALHTAFYAAKDLGHGDLAWQIAGHLHSTAQAIGEPLWIGLADFVRSHAMVGDGARQRAFELSDRAAANLAGAGADPVQGMLHLSAALHAAALRRPEQSREHLWEARVIAQRTGETDFAELWFGPRNVGVWGVALAVEVGDGGRARELARSVDVDGIPGAGRRATFYADLGRGMAIDPATHARAVYTLRQAESLAPQMIRTHFYVRETVGQLLGERLPRDAAQTLRGMATRMGITA